jgi:hypothetical protein
VAMRSADVAAAKHVGRAKDIRSLPAVAPQHQCEAIAREQADYIRTRRHND